LSQKKNIFFYLVLSIVGAILISTLAFFDSASDNLIGIQDKLFIVILSIPACIFGISIAFFPRWYKKKLNGKNEGIKKENPQKKEREKKGHHPNCDQFQSHTVKIKNKTYCSGCLGLAIGSIITIFLLIFYIFIEIPKNLTILYLFILLGIFIICIVYIEIIFLKRKKIFHVLANIFLMVSFFLIVVGIFEITGNKIYGLITIILSFLWLDTRIQLSKWQHSSICNKCVELCKNFIIF
jgi:hypothetical protein